RHDQHGQHGRTRQTAATEADQLKPGQRWSRKHQIINSRMVRAVSSSSKRTRLEPSATGPSATFLLIAEATTVTSLSMNPTAFHRARMSSVTRMASMSSMNTIMGCEISARTRSEEHTSELQSRFDLVCRLLLEKK